MAIDFISIHSLRMEGDIDSESTHENEEQISIHSLRMEGDTLQAIEVEIM